MDGSGTTCSPCTTSENELDNKTTRGEPHVHGHDRPAIALSAAAVAGPKATLNYPPRSISQPIVSPTEPVPPEACWPGVSRTREQRFKGLGWHSTRSVAVNPNTATLACLGRPSSSRCPGIPNHGDRQGPAKRVIMSRVAARSRSNGRKRPSHNRVGPPRTGTACGNTRVLTAMHTAVWPLAGWPHLHRACAQRRCKCRLEVLADPNTE